MTSALSYSPRAAYLPRRAKLRPVEAKARQVRITDSTALARFRQHQDRVSRKLGRSLQAAFAGLAGDVDWSARSGAEIPAAWGKAIRGAVQQWARDRYVPTQIASLQAGGRYLRDAWRRRAKDAAWVDPEDIVDGWSWEGGTEALADWLATRTAELVVQMSQRQLATVAAVIRHYVLENPMPNEFVARQLRGCVGLLEQQVDVLARMRSVMEADGMSADAIQRRIDWYSRIQLRRRTENIARTETSYAWHQGERESVRQLIDAGEISENVRRQWWTADDEATCDICGPLHMTEAGLDEDFPGGIDGPPAHPQCRCSCAWNGAAGD